MEVSIENMCNTHEYLKHCILEAREERKEGKALQYYNKTIQYSVPDYSGTF